MPIIQCKELYKHFGEGDSKVEALRGVSLTIQPGEIRLLMGPSGSGKTTLISIIAGILTPDSGDCIIGDVHVHKLQNHYKTHFRRKEIGFVFQSFNLIPTLSIEENVAIPLILNGVSYETSLKKAQESLEELGLKPKLGRYPPELSGGQQQRVAIARAIIHRPQLIVCDEPTSYLDAENGLKIMELLRQLVKQNHLTLIVVTHDTRITSFADQINYLEDGRIRS